MCHSEGVRPCPLELRCMIAVQPAPFSFAKHLHPALFVVGGNLRAGRKGGGARRLAAQRRGVCSTATAGQLLNQPEPCSRSTIYESPVGDQFVPHFEISRS